jgi:hypothetical protein
VEYGPGDQVRKVQAEGWISFRGQDFHLGRAFRGEAVALRPTSSDGVWEVVFCNQRITKINLKNKRYL